jgi:hypothetical protein
MSLSPRHESAGRSIPARPYRDSALLYGALAVVIVVISLLTGGDVARAAVVAAVFWVLATGWTWFRFHRRLAARAAAERARDGEAG